MDDHKTMRDHSIDQYSQNLKRVCQNKTCQRTYTIRQYLESSGHYFPRPFYYRSGCDAYCLECWLGLVPDNSLEGDTDINRVDEMDEPLGSQDFALAAKDEDWPCEAVYDFLIDGDVLKAFEWFLEKGSNLAVMPIARLHVERTVVFPGAITFYPAGVLDLGQLNLISSREAKPSLAEMCSAAAGITREVLEYHPLVVFPCRFDWQVTFSSGHETHLDIIRRLSEEVDRCCLNFVRYRSCILEPVPDEGLPAHAGQVASNPMMAGALLYCGAIREARIIGGAAFSHCLTRGMGLPLDQLEWDAFPQEGEVGQIVNHAISLYTALLEAPNATVRFMQALNLLEFLACPDEYLKFKEVAKIIARYVTLDHVEYQRILERFYELTGKKSESGRIIGYRTRVVHMGERIDRLVPDPQARRQLFLELDGFIRAVIDHMVAHSEKPFEVYLKVRETLRPFER